tara:strand:+ start:204 stop:1007 length:804 start_codon:yes stop_codon:yes gene_type:complete
MKLGIAYNIFDGEELLRSSLENMRDMVDFISVVYQNVSNFGNVNENLEPLLMKLKEEKLIDFCFKYEPKFKKDDSGNIHWQNGTENEQEKRNIGLNICKANGCDYFMTIDSDEFYDKKQFEWAKKDFIKGDYDTSFCQMQTYYKEPIYKVTPPELYYCPLFYKIKESTKFTYDFAPPYPVEIDPTRRVVAGYSRIYNRSEIEMHHFSYIRSNINSKIQNTSAQMDKVSKDEVIFHFNNFKSVSDGALFLGMQYFKLEEVDNKFNIKV